MSGAALVAIAASIGNLLQGWDNATIAESPRWLVSKGRMAEAKKVLQRLRGREDVSAIISSCPDCVFNCVTLEEMIVSATTVREVVAPKSVCLPCLKKLCLDYVQLSDPSVAEKLSSGCPTLEDLDLSWCLLGLFRISSDTLKTLSVTACDYLEIHVSAPNVVSLRLSVAGRVKLDGMPSLLNAWLYVSGDGLNPHAVDRHDFLDDLCNAQYLELFRFDLLLKDMMDKPATEGPTFNKLKSLYLGEWLVADFFRPFALTLDQWKESASWAAGRLRKSLSAACPRAPAQGDAAAGPSSSFWSASPTAGSA